MGTRVAAVKLQHIKQFRNPHTGKMEDNLFGAKWSLGVVSDVNEVQVMMGNYDRGSAVAVAHASHFKKTLRRCKYTVAFDEGDTEADIPFDRIRSDDSPAPARPEGRAGDVAAPEAAVATEAVAAPEAAVAATAVAVSPEAVQVEAK